MSVRVKICGLTQVDDALAAARLGADAIGLVFYAPSPRAVTVAQARAIVAALPPMVTTVGLFVDAAATEVQQVLGQVPLDVLQFHGDESADYCARFGRPWWKALRVRPGLDLSAAAAHYAAAQALLLDAYVPGVPGGTGERFDWSLIPPALPLPVILAGGLTPDNVRTAIDSAAPWGVDVSGGVEAIDDQGRKRPGIKSAAAMAALIEHVRNLRS
ncbi:phosphoribosylanthranilate isomerase [Isoalcanivorax beigongshangi]|uniref:N-(5'-phosphoribosyl)anthranilate isomerase n=1 Tax=Isoalcanivorax beigongshangi TaxID=3238810 RepID=A0ABV4AJ72_9GAMM